MNVSSVAVSRSSVYNTRTFQYTELISMVDQLIELTFYIPLVKIRHFGNALPSQSLG